MLLLQAQMLYCDIRWLFGWLLEWSHRQTTNHELGPAPDMPLTHVAQLEKRCTHMCLEVGGSHVNDQQVPDHLL